MTGEPSGIAGRVRPGAGDLAALPRPPGGRQRPRREVRGLDRHRPQGPGSPGAARCCAGCAAERSSVGASDEGRLRDAAAATPRPQAGHRQAAAKRSATATSSRSTPRPRPSTWHRRSSTGAIWSSSPTACGWRCSSWSSPRPWCWCRRGAAALRRFAGRADRRRAGQPGPDQRASSAWSVSHARADGYLGRGGPDQAVHGDACDQVYGLFDSTKVNGFGLHSFAAPDRITGLFTDDEVPAGFRHRMDATGVRGAHRGHPTSDRDVVPPPCTAPGPTVPAPLRTPRAAVIRTAVPEFPRSTLAPTKESRCALPGN